jgi:replicative DNA helicase
MFTTATLQKRRKGLPFDADFQRRLVRTLYQDAAFAASLVGLLDAEAFESRVLRWVIDKIFWYHDQYKTHPTKMVLEREAKKAVRFGAVQGADITALARTLDTLDNPTPDRSYLEDEVYKFIKRSETAKALHAIEKAIRTNDFDAVDAEMTKASSFKPARTNEFGKTAAHNVKERVKRRLRQQEFGITSGTPIDRVMKSEGIQRKQVGIVIGPTGRGKTATLVHNACAAAEDGSKVLYISLELDEDDILDRIDARLCSIDMNNLKKKPKTIQEMYMNKLATVGERIHTKYYPPGSLSVGGLRAYIKKLETIGFYPDLIVCDYVDLMKPTLRFEAGDDYAAQGSVVREMRGLMGELNMACWTASQANRGALDVEVVDKQHVADSFQKMFIADVVVTLCQTLEEKNRGITRLFLAKNRNGYDGMEFYVKLNTAQCRIIEMPTPVKQQVKPNQPKAAQKIGQALRSGPVITPTIRRKKTTPSLVA